MPNPHYNFYPPAGQVVDASDSRVTWNGRSWMLNGRTFGVPSSHRLIGKPGGPLAGWYYDWGRHAWMDNTRPPPNGGVGPSAMSFHPGLAFHPGLHPSLAPHPSLVPHPLAPAAPHPASQPPAQPPEKEKAVTEDKHHHNNTLDALIKHPIAPLIGGVLLLAAQFTDEPQPPTIPQELPEAIAKQWQMIFNQNQQRFQRRMEMYENLGMVLLGYAGTNAVLAALPPKRGA